jgi:hypothetical protein
MSMESQQGSLTVMEPEIGSKELPMDQIDIGKIN